MSRPRRSPASPGRVAVVCTGRGRHNRVPLGTLQLRRDGEAVRLVYNTREGPAPVTPFAAPNDIATYDLKCGTCGRHLKRHEDWLIQTAFALAGHQGISGDDSTPIVLDISTIERA